MRVWDVNPGYFNRQRLLGNAEKSPRLALSWSTERQGMHGIRKRGAGSRPAGVTDET
jgi:hypothetical protein